MDRDLSVELGADPSTFEVPPHRPEGLERFQRKNAMEEMLAAERKKSQRSIHMWDEQRRLELRTANDLEIPTDKRARSGFDRRLAFKGLLNYYVQNRKIYKGGVKVVQLSEVPEKVEIPEKRYPKGEVLPAGVVYLRQEIANFLAIGDHEILESEPDRCKICIDFLGRSQLDLTAHYRKAHPKELDELVAGLEKIREDEETAKHRELPPEPQAPRPRRQSFRGAGAA